MRRLFSLAAATAILFALAPPAARADDAEKPIDPAQKLAFDKRVFGTASGADKAYACFVRRYDSDHLARHPLQKVSAMKLLVTAEKEPENAGDAYSFRLGFKYRNRKGDYDSSGSCRHVVAEDEGHQLRFGCGVDCDGGGIDVALANDDKSTLVSVERVRIWQHNKPDEEASGDLEGGADDRIFRLDRTDLRECASLVTDRKELAALRRK
jgi:hypothetical protein